MDSASKLLFNLYSAIVQSQSKSFKCYSFTFLTSKFFWTVHNHFPALIVLYCMSTTDWFLKSILEETCPYFLKTDKNFITQLEFSQNEWIAGRWMCLDWFSYELHSLWFISLCCTGSRSSAVMESGQDSLRFHWRFSVSGVQVCAQAGEAERIYL